MTRGIPNTSERILRGFRNMSDFAIVHESDTYTESNMNKYFTQVNKLIGRVMKTFDTFWGFFSDFPRLGDPPTKK